MPMSSFFCSIEGSLVGRRSSVAGLSLWGWGAYNGVIMCFLAYLVEAEDREKDDREVRQ